MWELFKLDRDTEFLFQCSLRKCHLLKWRIWVKQLFWVQYRPITGQIPNCFGTILHGSYRSGQVLSPKSFLYGRWFSAHLFSSSCVSVIYDLWIKQIEEETKDIKKKKKRVYRWKKCGNHFPCLLFTKVMILIVHIDFSSLSF